MPLLHDMETPFLPFRPAATRTILPVLPELQTVVEVVLPSMLTCLTLVGPRPPTLFFVILLTMQTGPALSPALVLWTVIPKLLLGRFDVVATPIFGARSRNVLSIRAAPSPRTVLFPILMAVFAMSPPPRMLQLIMITLLSTRVLAVRHILIAACFVTSILRLRKLTQATASPVPVLSIATEQPLLKLATMLPAVLLFILCIAVFNIGLPVLLHIAFAMAIRVTVLIESSTSSDISVSPTPTTSFTATVPNQQRTQH